MLAKGGTVAAGKSVGPVVGVELYAGLGGINLHGATKLRLNDTSGKTQLASFLLVEHEAVVVTGAILNLLIVGIDIAAHRLRGGKVEGSALHLEHLAGRYGCLIDGQVEVGIDFYNLVQRIGGGVAQSLQAEESVTGHVDHSFFVGLAAIVDNQLVIVGPCVAHSHAQLAGEPFLVVGRHIAQHERLLINLFSIPDAGMETSGASVQVVGTIVDGQVILLAVEVELALGDTVAVAADEGTEERLGAVDDAVNVVVTLDNVGNVAIAVGYHNRNNGTAIVGDAYLIAGSIL